MKEKIKELLTKLISPVTKKLLKIGFTPNTATIFGFFLNGLAAWFIGTKHLLIAGILVSVAGFFDLLDGMLARQLNHTQKKSGALIDSTVDRYSEAVILLGILITVYHTSLLNTILVFAALFGSLMVSYIRARAEGLDLKCEIGFLTRPERVIIIGLGLIFNQLFLTLWIIAILANLTALHRFFYILKKEKNVKFKIT